jgi:hypothetical protein
LETPDPIQEATGSPGHIAIGRHAFYEPIVAKSIFYHELGHSALGGGDEIAATQTGISAREERMIFHVSLLSWRVKFAGYRQLK